MAIAERPQAMAGARGREKKSPRRAPQRPAIFARTNHHASARLKTRLGALLKIVGRVCLPCYAVAMDIARVVETEQRAMAADTDTKEPILGPPFNNNQDP